ncbi:hypothetical protein Purlil1_12536 [Purpureocillium lilacinum]|uniref:Peptidase S8/S53 domain-containing protein n=1 Tax=Purpureocillium lilacinum TaxID=33203 RepID=A0ABR0BGN5_PURLI|nr:hypothetical protein Purlil1_12536 [Purpureocillium lilacinum]
MPNNGRGGRQSSVLDAYRLVCDGLSAIRTQSVEIRRMKQVDDDHRHELASVDAGAFCLIKILQDIRRSSDLRTIATHIYDIAGRLELRLTEDDPFELVWKDIASFQFPRLRSRTARFCYVLKSLNECNRLQAEMGMLCTALGPFLSEDDVDDDDAKPSQLSIPYDHLFYPSADRLFEAISGECQSGQEIRLRLGTLQSTHPPEDDRSLDILFRCNDEQESYWLALRLHSHLRCVSKGSGAMPPHEVQVPALRVTFEETNHSEEEDGLDADDVDSWRLKEPCTYNCICSYTKEMSSVFKTYLQHVELDELKSWQIHDCVIVSPSEFPAEEYSLPELFTEMNWTEVDKIVLAMQLAYALAYYYEGGWLSGRWQPANICFFRWGSRIPCKPWLKISLHDSTKREASRPVGHPFPQLLELGILLLELQLGQSLDSFLGKRPAKNVLEKWAYATTTFFGKLHGGSFILSRHYRHAIEFCLKPNKVPKESSLLREEIYNNVVLPLEEAILESNLSDQALEALDLGLIKRVAINCPGLSERRTPARETASAIPVGDVAGIEVQGPTSQPLEEFTSSELEEGFELFGDEEELEPDKDRSKASDSWIKNVKNIIDDRIGKLAHLSSPRRVKVALLDTGIDLKHAYFDGEYPCGRIKSVRSWVDGKEGAEEQQGGDESGHGTFIASLLLSLGPNVDLYVARVSKSRSFRKGTAMNVANALYYAQETWDVDIITMSFGFPQGIVEIEKQITRITQREKNILMFAAASNDGRNRSRMYPARNRSVFAIHSTNGKGIKSDFNPPPEMDQNLSILGEYIESAWLTSEVSNGCTRRLSGTSFATPIAVCLSVFLLTYVPMVIPEHETLFHKIQSYDGMQSVLQAIVAVDEVDPGSRYQYLAIERFFNHFENTQQAIIEAIRKALKG